MKKTVLIFTLFLTINSIAADNTPNFQEQHFVNPIFYQQLSSLDKKSFYVLTPNSKYYESSKTHINPTVHCSLVENGEYCIKICCDFFFVILVIEALRFNNLGMHVC